jgi:hypothetical protein
LAVSSIIQASLHSFGTSTVALSFSDIPDPSHAYADLPIIDAGRVDHIASVCYFEPPAFLLAKIIQSGNHLRITLDSAGHQAFREQSVTVDMSLVRLIAVTITKFEREVCLAAASAIPNTRAKL